MRAPNALTILVLIAAAFGFVAVWDRPVGVPGFWVSVAAIVAYVLWLRFNTGAVAKRWLARAANGPLVLQPPFADTWYVAQGGPDPRHNRYQRFGDQHFAYDFQRVDGSSWDQPILAPVDGMIVHVESRRDDGAPDQDHHDRARPFGNYVSIQTPHGYVVLSHIKAGSIAVRVGEGVKTGDEIGRSGNSGDSRGASLHIHAQNQPSAVDSAQGVPIAFVNRGSAEPMLLEFGDRLG